MKFSSELLSVTSEQLRTGDESLSRHLGKDPKNYPKHLKGKRKRTPERPHSSLHNIIFKSFCLVFIFWILFLPNKVFSFLCHSCSKKFYWRSKVTIILERENIFCQPQVQFGPLIRRKKYKAWFERLESNRLHNTRTRRKEFKMILWRLLPDTLFWKPRRQASPVGLPPSLIVDANVKIPSD